MPITDSDLMAITIPSDADHRRSEATLGRLGGLQVPDYDSKTISGLLESEKQPLENRIWVRSRRDLK